MSREVVISSLYSCVFRDSGMLGSWSRLYRAQLSDAMVQGLGPARPDSAVRWVAGAPRRATAVNNIVDFCGLTWGSTRREPRRPKTQLSQSSAKIDYSS